MLPLTHDQAYIAEILEETKCLTVNQVHRLLQLLDAGKDKAYAGRILSQLRNISRLCWIDDSAVTLPNLREKPVDSDMLLTIDIMLDLLEAPPMLLSASSPPFKLRFFAEQNENPVPFGVVFVPHGKETFCCEQLTSHSEDISVVFLLSNFKQSKSIRTKHTHYFAVYDNKKLRYFRGNGAE